MQNSASKDAKANLGQTPNETQSTNDSAFKQEDSDNSVGAKSPKN